MIYYYIWTSTNPELQEHLRRANEHRSAAWFAFFKAIGGGFGALRHAATAVSGWLSRRIRERAAIRELSALSEHELKDIGIARNDIPWIAGETARGVEEPRAAALEARNRLEAQRLQRLARSKPYKIPVWLRGVIDGDRQHTVEQPTPAPGRAHRGEDAPKQSLAGRC